MSPHGRTCLMFLKLVFLTLPIVSNAKQYKGIECRGNSPGKYSLHADCASYVTCYSNSSYTVTFCPPGKQFHTFFRTCEPEKTVDCSKHLYSSESNQEQVRYGSTERNFWHRHHLRQRRYAKVISPTRPFGVFEKGVYIPFLIWKGSKLPECANKSAPGEFHGRGFFKRRNITQITTTPPISEYPDEIIEDAENDSPDVYFNLGKETNGEVEKQVIKNKKVHFLSDDNGQGAYQESLIGKKVNKNQNQAWTQKPNEAFTVQQNDVVEVVTEVEPWAYYADAE